MDSARGFTDRLLDAAGWGMGHAPLWLADWISRSLAWVWWSALPIRRGVAIDNFSRAFPEIAPGPALRRCLAGLILGYFEMFRQIYKQDIQFDIVGLDGPMGHIHRGEGVLILSSHTGCWDMCYPELSRQGGPFQAIVKPPSNPAVARKIAEVRGWFGMETLPPRGCMPRIYERLTQGQAIAFFLDQRFNQGIPVPLFDRPAWTAPSLAAAARRSGAPVFGIWYQRLRPGHHRITVTDALPITGDVEVDTARFNAEIADWIRQAPWNWLWLHDRWKVPAGAVELERGEAQ